jgi:hypothetical protein
LAYDFLSSTRQQVLWRLWPPLFLAFESDALWKADPVAIDAAFRLFGSDIGSWTPTLATLVGDDETPYAAPDAMRFQGVELSIDVTQLRRMRTALGMLPAGPLDPDAWILANFDWLIRLKNDEQAERRAISWLNTCLYPAQSDLYQLRSLGVADPIVHIERRWPTADHGPLRMLPFVVGATTLVERATARGILEDSALLRETDRSIHSPREAFVAAEELYTRDLCVMDLLLVRWLSGRGTYDHRA